MLTCTFSGGEDGTPITYQWHRDGTLLTAQTSQTLIFSPLREADTGEYTCTVMRDSLNDTISETVSINVEGWHMHS